VNAEGKKYIISNKQLQDNIAFKCLVNALNLNYMFTYDETQEGNKQFNTLYYGAVCMCTDFDEDGIGNINPLILSFFLRFWPALIKRGFVKYLRTPIIRTYQAGKSKNFYSEKEFDDWAKKNYGSQDKIPSSYKVKYYKGLSSHSREEVLYDIGANILSNIIVLKWDDKCIQTMLNYYDKDSDIRKQILKTPVSESYTTEELATKEIQVSKHYNIEAKSFKLETLQRKLISALDGLVPSQRMALMSGKTMRKTQKTMVFVGYVIESYLYPHGDTSMSGVVSRMAQTMVGSNNLPLFLPASDGFGTRKLGRDDNGSPRYTYIKTNSKLVDLLYPKEDDFLLEYLWVEGKRVQPKYLVPIMPMSILESITCPANGWKIDVIARSWTRVYSIVKELIADENYKIPTLAGHPWIAKKMKVYLDGRKREVCEGTYALDEEKNTITINELPLRVWSESQKNYLLGIKAAEAKSVNTGRTAKKEENTNLKYVVNCDDDTGTNVRVVVQLEDDSLTKIKSEYEEAGPSKDPVINYLGLYRYFTSCLNMIAKDGTVIEFKNYEDVIKYWFTVRRDLYKERIKRRQKLLECELVFYKEKLRFIMMDSADPKEIEIDKKPTVERDAILKENKFKIINHTHLEHPEYTKADKMDEYIFETGASYKYIYNIRVDDKSEESITALKDLITKTEEEIAKLKKSKWQDLWLSELTRLNEVVKKGIESGWKYEQKEIEFSDARESAPKKKTKKKQEEIFSPLTLPD
jgi:DNA topoisomerase-2